MKPDASNEALKKALEEALNQARTMAWQDMSTVWVHRPDSGGHSEDENCACMPYPIKWNDPRDTRKIVDELEARWRLN